MNHVSMAAIATSVMALSLGSVAAAQPPSPVAGLLTMCDTVRSAPPANREAVALGLGADGSSAIRDDLRNWFDMRNAVTVRDQAKTDATFAGYVSAMDDPAWATQAALVRTSGDLPGVLVINWDKTHPTPPQRFDVDVECLFVANGWTDLDTQRAWHTANPWSVETSGTSGDSESAILARTNRDQTIRPLVFAEEADVISLRSERADDGVPGALTWAQILLFRSQADGGS